MRNDIQAALNLIRAHAEQLEDEELIAFLAEQLGEPLATQLIVFLPMAYAHIWLAGIGIRCPDYIEYHEPPPGLGKRHRLSSFAVWPEILAFAETEIANGVSTQDLFQVASRDASFKAVNQALLDGAKPQNLVLSPPVLLCNLHQEALLTRSAKRPWWKFW